MTRFLPFATALLVAVLFGTAPEAGIVNVLPAAGAAEEDGFSGSLQAPLQWERGNTNDLTVGLTSHTRFRTGPNLVLLVLDGELGRANGETYRRRAMGHLRFRHQLTERVAPEAFTQHSWDPFRRLRSRTLVGVGPRFTLAQGEAGAVFLGTAWMPEWERYTREEGVGDSGARVFTHRWSSYLELTLALGDQLLLGHTSYAQPSFTDLQDVRLSSVTSLRTGLGGAVFLELRGEVELDRRAAEEVEPLDRRVRVVLGVEY
ncbi:MAG: DUF481 domain-containing protein [Deltaproteobacteria bacterium]|nr:MAG: DUF481 domain-containing protein [Deltaproteobacteria bacterium]